ncbi:MAG TPA: GNAT family N-acetyltransferase [Chloroflexota bacterium]
MGDSPIVWVRIRWSLEGIAALENVPRGYRSRVAARPDLSAILDLVLAAFGSDPVWAPAMPAVRRRLAERVDTTLGAEGCEYLMIEQDESITGVSGIAREHWTDQNLLTGVCVAPQHRRRGLAARGESPIADLA